MLHLLLSLALAEDPRQQLFALELQRAPAAAFSDFATSPDPALRARAALALGRIKDPDALTLLAPLVADADPEVRAVAAWSLGLTPGGEILTRTALEREEDPLVRARHHQALGLQARPEDLPRLVAALEASPVEAASAAQALGRYGLAKVDGVQGTEVIDGLAAQTSRLDPDARLAAAFALARIGPTQPGPGALERMHAGAAHSPDPDARSFLYRALASSCEMDATCQGLLAQGLLDVDKGVRVNAARSLGEHASDAEARLALADPNPAVRLAAIQGLGKNPSLDLEELLGPVFEGGSELERAEALRVLGGEQRVRDGLNPDQPLVVRQAAISQLDDQDQLLRLAQRGGEPGVRTAAAGRLMELEPDLDRVLELTRVSDLAVVAAALERLPKSADEGDEAAIARVQELLASSQDPDVLRAGHAALDALDPEGEHAPEAPSLEIPDLAEVQRIASFRILTEAGELRVLADTDLAPYTVWNFAKLAEQDYFDGLVFHRVVPDFVIQDGCPRGDGWGGPGWTIPDELSWLPYDEGVLGMALSGPDTGGSQWFLTLSAQPHLDANYTVFGRLDVGKGTLQTVQRGTVITDVVVERVP